MYPDATICVFCYIYGALFSLFCYSPTGKNVIPMSLNFYVIFITNQKDFLQKFLLASIQLFVHTV
jgi:hypothetical protein